MVALPKFAPSRMTVDEFLDWPGDGSAQKFELIDGELRAIAPASVSHGIIQANVAGILRSHLIGKSPLCRGRARRHSASEIGREHASSGSCGKLRGR
jgi:Uma2 family endonuclease